MKKLLSLLSFFVFQGALYAASADAVLGVWLADKNKSKIEIYKCEQKYCGRVVWLKEPNFPHNDYAGMAGQVKIDRVNPDEALRTRPIIGLVMIRGFDFNTSPLDEAGKPEWINGEIYDPNNGATYSSVMSLTDNNILDVTGYIGIPLFGRSVRWTR